MAYRNGTYIAFHANGTSVPYESDMKYYNLLKAWNVREECEFEFVNSHDKTQAVRDSSKKETLKRVLIERLRNSKNFILIIGDTTRDDRDWVPFEIEYAVDVCRIPIVAAYPEFEAIGDPARLRPMWPKALADRIDNGLARVVHVPFKQGPLKASLAKFDVENLPPSGQTYFGPDSYHQWGLRVPTHGNPNPVKADALLRLLLKGRLSS